MDAGACRALLEAVGHSNHVREHRTPAAVRENSYESIRELRQVATWVATGFFFWISFSLHHSYGPVLLGVGEGSGEPP